MRAWTGLVSTSSYCVYPFIVLLHHNLFQLSFSYPPATEYDTTNIVIPPPGSGGHEKSYNRVYPQTKNKANTTMNMYPATVDLFTNYHAFGDVSIILPHRTQQRPLLPLAIIFRHLQLVESTVYFNLYYYELFPLSLSPA